MSSEVPPAPPPPPAVPPPSDEVPPPPPPILEDKWVRIQENTFANWVNQQLRETEYEIKDIGTEFCDGVKLCALVAALQNKKTLRGMKTNPKNRHQMIENVTQALQATKLDKIKIVNIGAEDIVNGNKKLILGLIWSYILRYQIGKSEIPPMQLMLAWLNAVIPECNIKNFTTNWNDGKALFALIDYCEPGLAPDWRNMSTRDRAGNCESAMRLAQERLGVPVVVSPQHMASSDLDKLSGMTYMSYFMKVNSCGYKATLRDVNNLIPANHVSNFTSDWRDGLAVCALVQAVGGHIPEWPSATSSDLESTKMERTHLGLQAGKEIGIQPIMQADDMVQPQVGHLAVMAYAARFMNKPAVRLSAANYVEIMFNTVDITPGSTTSYSLLMKQGDPRLHSINVTITDPSGNNVPTSVDWQQHAAGEGIGTFVPTVTGAHKLRVECDGEIIRGCPINFNVAGGKKVVSVLKRDQGVVGEISRLEIVCDADSDSDVQMICTSPSGDRKQVQLARSSSTNSLSNSFVPDCVGEWEVAVLCQGQHTPGSPFTMNVIKPHAVRLCNLEGGVIGQPFTFTVDTSEAGKAELQCVITSSGRVVPSTIQSTGRSEYSVKFVPTGPGLHLIRTMYGGKDVREEPYKVEIADSNLVQTEGVGLKQARINQTARFSVDVGKAGTGDVVVDMRDASGGVVPCLVRRMTDRLYDVTYIPLVIGSHELVVRFADKQVRDSPFTVNVYNDPTATVPSQGPVGKPVMIELNTTDTGKGDLNIIVNGGSVPVTTRKLAKDRHSAEFIPASPGQFTIELEFNGHSIQDSPWYVNVAPAAPLLPEPAPAPPRYSTLNVPQATSAVVASTTHAAVAATQYARVGETRSFDVNSVHKTDIQVKIQDEFGGNVPQKTSLTGDGVTVSYEFQRVGNYWINLQTKDGHLLRGSPFLVCAFDPSLVTVSGMKTTGQVNVPASFAIDAKRAGKGEVTVFIDHGDIPCAIHANGDQTYRVSYVSAARGTRIIEVLFNKLPVTGSPFTCSYGSPVEERRVKERKSGAPVVTRLIPSTPAMPVSVHGDGLHIGEEDKMAAFVINANKQQGQPEVRIEGPHSVAKCDIQPIDYDTENKKFKVTYVPVETGIYNIYVKWNNRDIDGSPYHPRVVDSRKVRLDGDWHSHLDQEQRLQLQVSQTKRLLFDVTRAGPGELKARGRHLTSGSALQCTVSEKDQFHYWLDILASEPGEATIDIEWSDYAIPQSPLRATVTEPSTMNPPAMNGHASKKSNKVVLSGTGFQMAAVGHPSEFYIDGSVAEPGSPEVVLKNSQLQRLDVNVERLTSQEYKCSYVVEQPGTYMLHVRWNGNDLDHSPYTVIALGSSPTSTVSSKASDGPEKISVHGTGVNPGILATFDGVFVVDTENAGRGECEVKIKGPKGDVRYSSSLEGPRHRLLQCEYNPTEVGLYVIRVKWSGQEIPVSPLVVHIFDTYEELNSFKTTKRLPVFMNAQDTVSIHSARSVPVITRSGRKAQSLQNQPRKGGSMAQHPPQRSYTAGPRANGSAPIQHNAARTRSFFIVKENAPGFVHKPAQSQSVFIADH